MKNMQPLLNVFLLSGISLVLYVLSQAVSPGDASRVSEARADNSAEAGRSAVHEFGTGHIVAGRLLGDAFAPAGPLDVVANEVEMDITSHAPIAQTQVDAGNPGHEVLMAEASRIMLELYRDGILVASVGIACAGTDAQPDVEGSTLVIERYRDMHRKYDTQLELERKLGDQDPGVVHGWTEIRSDLLRLQNLALELRDAKAAAAITSRPGGGGYLAAW